MADDEHCGTCAEHTFEGHENYCKSWGKVIPRDKWDVKRENGKPVCWCDRYRNWTQKKARAF